MGILTNGFKQINKIIIKYKCEFKIQVYNIIKTYNILKAL